MSKESIFYTNWTVKTKWILAFKLVTADCDSNSRMENCQIKQQFWICYRSPLMSQCEKPWFVFRWRKWHLVWSSATVVNLLQLFICSGFRYGLLHTLVVKSIYLSHSYFSIILNQSASSDHFSYHCCSLNFLSFFDKRKMKKTLHRVYTQYNVSANQTLHCLAKIYF